MQYIYIYGAYKPVTRTIFIPSDKRLNKHAASWPAKNENLRLKEARREAGNIPVLEAPLGRLLCRV